MARNLVGWLKSLGRTGLVSTQPSAQVLTRDPLHPTVEQAQRQLGSILDRHPMSRKVFGDLALLEHGLRYVGAKALHLPAASSLLRRACQQLDAVAGETEAQQLKALLQDAVARHRPAAPGASSFAPAPPECRDFSTSQPGKVAVAEVDPLSYFEVMRAWQDTLVEEEEQAATVYSSRDPVEWSETLPMSA